MRTKNDEKFKQIRMMHNAGKTREEIAIAFNYKPSSITGVMNRMGISFARDLTKEHEMMIKMRKEEKTLAEMSEATGLSQCSISTYLNKMGMSTSKKIDHGAYAQAMMESNLTYAPPKQIKKVVDNGKCYDDVTEMLYQQYEG